MGKICIKCGVYHEENSYKITRQERRGNVCVDCRNIVRRKQRQEAAKIAKEEKEIRIEYEKSLIPKDHKKCTRCKELKHFDDFEINNNSPDGFSWNCRDCLSIKRMEQKIKRQEAPKIIIDKKTCICCGGVFDIENFQKNGNTKDGYDWYCRPCKRKKGSISAKRQKDRDKIVVEEKKCSKCGDTKKIEEFRPRRVSKDGHDTMCRSCVNERSRNKYSTKEFTKEEKLKKTIKGSIHDRFRRSIKRKNATCLEYGVDFDFIFDSVGPRPSDDFELDHIIPLALFDYSDPAQIYLSQHPGNLRWLPSLENNLKHDKIIWDLIKDNPFLFYIATNVLKLDESYDGLRAKDIKESRGIYENDDYLDSDFDEEDEE